MSLTTIARCRTRSVALSALASSTYNSGLVIGAARWLHRTAPVREEQPSPTPASGDVRAQLKNALKTAMKARDKAMTTTIKSALSDITYQEKSSAKPNEAADNGTVIEVMRKTIEKRRQAAEAYPEGDPARADLLREVDLLSSFLPQTLASDAIESKLRTIVDGLSAEQRQSRSATGTVLAEFWRQVDKSEVADKKSLGKIIAELLKSTS